MTREPRPLYISHGGGPLPLLGDDGHREMVEALRALAARIPRPDAIVVVSAHWEEPVFTVTAREDPPVIYDYSGFPEESYHIEYPCPGDPALAAELHDTLQLGGVEAQLDGERGLDHGVFVPMKIMYPAADVPCVQLSLQRSLDPETHIAAGRALRALARKDVLLVGSGFSFHNLRAFFSPDTSESREENLAFETWLRDTCCNPDHTEADRARMLVNWQDAPGSRFCHPREEHLIPLHVCFGAAGARAAELIDLEIMNKKSSVFLW